MRPGLTGLAQVRRGYETSMAEKLAHDLEWVADRSVPLYLRTLFMTGLRVVRQTFGAADATAASASPFCSARRRPWAPTATAVGTGSRSPAGATPPA